MAKVVQTIVVARWNEDIGWLDSVEGWRKIVIQKNEDMPNIGREPASFLYAIIKNYSKIKPSDVWCFVQANPFPHFPDLLSELNKPFDDFRSLGSAVHMTNGTGQPDDSEIPVQILYEKYLAQDFPGVINFEPGGQFITCGANLLRYSLFDYISMFADSVHERDAYAFERLWAALLS